MLNLSASPAASRSAARSRCVGWITLENLDGPNITLQIFTNLQLFNDRIVKLLEPFRYIDFILSIDGIGDTYEYIRYPGKWSRIEEYSRLLVGEEDPGFLIWR